MTIDSVGYEGTISDGEVWANLQYALGNRYFVTDGSSLTATSVLSGTRQVSIGPGRFGGWGIYDFNNAAATVTLPVVSSGTKWFLIVARRTWSLLDGSETETQFVALDPGWTSAPTTLPATGTGINSFNQRPGIRDDQPLWIVPLSFGQNVPGTPLDVRLIGTGNNFVAGHDWVLQYANWPGIEIRRGAKLYKRNLTTWDITDSGVRLLSGSAVVAGSSTWSMASPLISEARLLTPNLVALHINMRLLSGSVASNATGDFPSLIPGLLVAALKPARNQNSVPMSYVYSASSTATAAASGGFLAIRASDGGIQLISGAPTTTIWPRPAPITVDSSSLRFDWVYTLATPYPL